MVRWSMAAIHLIALAVGFGSIWMRANALREVPDPGAIRRVLRADIWWGVAALLWLGTGIPRLMLGLEKPTSYYLDNHLFATKIVIFLVIVAIEVVQAVDFGRWRRALQRGQAPDVGAAPRWARFSRIEATLVLVIVLLATAMARGYGA
jgi:putative membrane protein